MAEFNAEINVAAKVDKALAQIGKLESKLQKITNVELNIAAKARTDIKQAVRSYNVLANTVKSIGKTAAFAATNFGKLVSTIGILEVAGTLNKFGIAKTSIGNFSQAITDAINPVVKFAATQPGLAAGIGLSVAALAAFGPQIATVSGRLLNLGKAAAAAKLPLRELVNTYSQLTGAFDDSFIDPEVIFRTEVVEAYRTRLFEISETVSELSKRQQSLKQNLDRFNSSSATAEKIAGKLVDVNARLNEELREQADLLRRVAGVNVTELEAAKGRKSIETRQKRDAFLGGGGGNSTLKAQERDARELQDALLKLEEAEAKLNNERLDARAEEEQIKREKQLRAENQESIKSIRRRNQLEERVANARSARIARSTQFARNLNDKFGQAPRALPSTEILNPDGRGIKRLSSFYGDLNTQIDKGVSSAKDFTNELSTQAAKAQGLPPIFNQVSQAFERAQTNIQEIGSLARQNRRQGQLFRGRANRQQRTDLNAEAINQLERINKLETNRNLQVDLRNKSARIFEAIKRNEFTLAKQITNEAEDLLDAEDKRIDRARRLLKFKQKQRREDKKAAAAARRGGGGGGAGGGLAAGIGFPLLFGGGPGSIVGGAIGSAGGFGTQVLASAIGGIIDQAVAGVAKLGQALNPLTADIDAVVAAAGESGTAFEKLVKDFEEIVGKEKALELATAKLAIVIGQDGVSALEQFGDESAELGRVFAKTLTQIGAAVADLINRSGILVRLAQSIENARLFNRAVTDPNQSDTLKALVKEFRRATQGKGERSLSQIDKDIVAEQRRLILAKEQNIPGKAEAEEFVATEKRLNITEQLQSAEKTVFDIAEKYGNIQKKQQEQQANFDRERVDIVRSFEENIAQTRENVERRILNLRIQGIQRANEIENQRATNELSSLQAANSAAARQQQESDVAAGTRPELAATGQTIDNAFRAIAEAELSTEQQKAQIKRDAAFEILKLELDGEKFKIDVAKQVSKLNLDTARRIESINVGIAKRNKDFSLQKFNIEKQIANTQLEVLRQQNVLLILQTRAGEVFPFKQQEYEKYIQGIVTAIEKTQNIVQTAQAPGSLSTLAPVGGESVSTDGADAALNNLIDRQRLLTAERLKSIDILKATNKEAEIAKVSQIRIDDQAKINRLLTEQLDALNAQERIIELQKQGRSESQAVAIQEVETTFRLIDANLGVAEAKLQGELAALQAVEADQRDLDTIEKIRKELERINKLRGGLPANEQQAVENAVKLNEGLTETEQLATDIAGTLGNGITDALVLAVSGTENLGEAFQALAADILQAIGKALILAAITKAIGGIGSGNTPGTGILGDIFREKGGPVTGNQPYVVGEKGPELFVPKFSGTVIPNDISESLPGFAKGGRPDPGKISIVGEEGPELFVPDSSGTVIPNEFFDSARDSLQPSSGTSNLENDTDNSEAFSAAAAAIARNTTIITNRQSSTNQETSLNNFADSLKSDQRETIRFETVRVGQMDMVTKDEALKIGAESAKVAEASVLSALRNKPKVRRSVGIN